MKAPTALSLLFSALLLAALPAHANEWFLCGNITQIGWSCQLADHPSNKYEYGIAWNTSEPQVATCSYWNYGMRVTNRHPYLVYSGNPQTRSLWGGFVFYSGTLASDDDTCSEGEWRHQYWHLDTNNIVKPLGSSGCFGSGLQLYCRLR
ncbi:hypothetical protein HPC49_30330 [Pyxidicoccus fallax]|uniref:Uncharacterized protein n=1 Tax=Pyxidicoccus fallax TaxID=394095 RepID=A0A848LL96_9BACT|nr:hypothetical protein [Pyxidicoccus fallax]NMO18587.1 hypothetical protein [Pyxidicoccus fallax]NPC82506.1 hypothetical protein [Pyxidicoccus fallax]